VRPPRRSILFAALVLVLCRAALDQGTAKVVQDGKAAHSNPAVDHGGVRPRARAEPNVQYVLEGSIASDGQWPTGCAPQAFRPLRWPRLFFQSFKKGVVWGGAPVTWFPP